MTKDRGAQLGIMIEFLIIVRTLGEFFLLRHVHGANFSTGIVELYVGGALIAACSFSADGLKVPQQPRNEMRVLTIDHARTLLKAAQGTKYEPVFAIALTTGMRPSEYLGLKWQDIDWTRQTAASFVASGDWMGNGVSQIRSVREAGVQSSCRAGLLLFFVICRRKRVGTICIQRPATWSSEHHQDSRSMPIISPSISDQYSTWRCAANEAL